MRMFFISIIPKSRKKIKKNKKILKNVEILEKNMYNYQDGKERGATQ